MKRLTVVIAVLLMVAACASSGPSLPKASSFHPGLCRQAAPALLATARRADKGGQSASLAADLEAQQTVLKRFTVNRQVQDLVTAMGLVRFQLDAHSYTDQLRKNVETAARSTIIACTTH